ncbi:MAG: lamin tail domain-containing protein, partial [Parcubacteria group bacterium]|nr:lamin tail domain-containing protein [Parcubacteria group bacterium]
MENCRSLKLILAILLLVLSFYFYSFAYDDQTTHPAITDEIVDFYNLKFDQKIPDNFKEQIIQGSIDEDQFPRYFNHFYDPVSFSIGTMGWKGYRNYALGHILHLIEDASVPEHTRDDTHLGHGSIGSPYENWAEKWKRDNINLLQNLNNENSLNFNTLEEYFDFIANYSNHNFFSEGTIFDRKYPSPIEESQKIDPESSILYGYGKDTINNKIFHLVRYDIDLASGFIRPTLRMPSDRHNLVLTDYWHLLSKQAILTGTGVVHLFQEQAETAYQQKLQSNIQASFFQKMFSAGQESVQLTGEWLTDKIKNTGNIVISAGQSGYYYIFLPAKDKAVDDYNQRFSPTNNSNLNLAATVFNLNQPTDVPPILELNQPTQPIPTPFLQGNNSPSVSEPAFISQTSNAIPNSSSEIPITNPENPSQNSSLETSTIIDSSQSVSQELPWWQTLGYSSAGSAPGSPNPPEVSLASEPEITPLDTTPPILPDITPPVSPSIASPLNNQTFNIFNLDTDFGVTIIGQTEPNSEVLIATELVCLELTSCNPVIPDQNGNWQVKVNLQSGENRFVFKAKDQANNESDPIQLSLFVNQITNPIVINEIAWQGTQAKSQDEWIELYNRTDQDIDLTDWQLKSLESFDSWGRPISKPGDLDIIFNQDDKETVKTFNPIIPAKGYYLIERTLNPDKTDSDTTSEKADWAGSFGNGLGQGLSNAGEVLSLFSSDGDLIDNFEFRNINTNQPFWPYLEINDWSEEKQTMKASLERINPDISSGEIQNWKYNNGIIKNGLDAGQPKSEPQPIIGTPKSQNSVYQSDFQPLKYFFFFSGYGITFLPSQVEVSNTPCSVSYRSDLNCLKVFFEVKNGSGVTSLYTIGAKFIFNDNTEAPAPPPGAYFPLGYTDWLTPPGPVIFGQLEYWGGLIKAIDPFSDFLFY